MVMQASSTTGQQAPAAQVTVTDDHHASAATELDLEGAENSEGEEHPTEGDEQPARNTESDVLAELPEGIEGLLLGVGENGLPQVVQHCRQRRLLPGRLRALRLGQDTSRRSG